MSDIGNMVAAVTELALGEVVELTGLPLRDGSTKSMICGDRYFLAKVNSFGLGYNVTGQRGPTASVTFDPFPRGLEVTEHMLAGEADVVTAFLKQRDAMPSGFYGFEDLPFLQWDWQDYGVQFNSHPEWWHRTESRVLRKRLHEANVPFQARRLTPRPARCGLRFAPDGENGPVWLWNWFRTGADELRASLELLAATLGIAGAFTPFYSAPFGKLPASLGFEPAHAQRADTHCA